MKGMYSSAMPIVEEPSANNVMVPATSKRRAVSKLPNGRADQRIDRAGGSDHSDGATDDEHEENDVSRGGHATRNGSEKSEGRQGRRFHFVKGSGDHLFALMSGFAH